MNAPVIECGTKRLTEIGLRIWRLLAVAKGRALPALEIARLLGGQVEGRPLTTALESLRRGGYVRNLGNHRHDSRWEVTRKVPLGEEPPLWMTGEEDASDEHDADETAVAPAIDPALIGSLGSAFRAGAAECWPFAGRVLDKPAIERALAAPVRPGVDWKAPASAVAPAAEDEPAKQTRFALYSDGVLVIARPDEKPVVLEQAETRALFRWLDQLQHATSLAEAAS